MPFEFDTNQSEPAVEAYREGDNIRLAFSGNEYRIPLSTARIICDLLSITVYDESIIALMAKRRRLTFEKEELLEKLQRVYNYHHRKERKKRCKSSL